MKIILFGMFILIFSMLNFAQPKLGEPFEIKKGETVELGGLKIKYLGGVSEWASGQDKQGKPFEIYYLRYRFDITHDGKTEMAQVVSPVKFGDLTLQVISSQRVEFNHSDEICKLVVMTSQQLVDLEKKKEADLQDVGKLSTVNLFAVEPIGFAAMTSEGETLARKILAQDKAEIAFKSILENGTPEAKLYALWALRKIHGRKSGEIFEPYRILSTEVHRMSGCEGFSEKFNESVKEIENPFYLKMKTKDLWTMELERRRALLTDEEERFLLKIFRLHKGNDFNTLNEIADIPFGELFQKEADKILKD
ncbi:MAG: hypothetical protein K1X72_15280 [Pyrinomonadaceae bacterium]|nr:hypothetical protein [Pyrinomonadaceae bacterium]